MAAPDETSLSVLFARALSSAARAANLPTIEDETQVGRDTLLQWFSRVLNVKIFRSSSDPLCLTYILCSPA